MLTLAKIFNKLKDNIFAILSVIGSFLGLIIFSYKKGKSDLEKDHKIAELKGILKFKKIVEDVKKSTRNLSRDQLINEFRRLRKDREK